MAHSISINTTTSHSGTEATTAVLRRARSRWIVIPIFVGLLGVFMLQLWLHTTHTSATYDEPFHVLAGYRYLQCGDYGINPEHPPLPKLLAALPIFTRALAPPALPCGSKATSKADGFLAGAKFVAGNGVDRILIPARVAMSLTALLLMVIVFLTAREMFGPVVGLVALASLAFEPNFIAHGALVTTDMAITASMFGAVYALYRYRQKPGRLRLLIFAVAVGLMLASKHSALLVLPILFLLLLADIVLIQRLEGQSFTFSSRKILHGALAFVAVFAVAFTLLWACYGFRYYALPNTNARAFALADFLDLTGASGKAVALLDRAHIFPEAYIYGLADIAEDNQNNGGTWSYFPRAFTMKSSVALLLLLPVGLAMPAFYRERRREMLFLLLPSLAYFAITMSSGINNGIRHLLPVYPFFIVLAAAGAGALGRRTKLAVVAISLLLVVHAAVSIRTFPNYIAFSNAFWGVDHTHEHLIGADVDWGQNLKLVKDYVEKNGNGRDCWFAYWGPGEVARVSQPCRLMPVGGWIDSTERVDIIPPVIEGLVFLSMASLPPEDRQFESFAELEPIALLGGGVKVYEGRFEIPLAAAASHWGRGRQLLNQRRFEEALSQNLEALKLVPEHPQAHVLLAELFAAAGKPAEARAAFEKTIQLAQNHEHFPEAYITRARNGLEKLK